MNKLFILIFIINIYHIYSFSLFHFINKLLNKNKEKIRIQQYNNYLLNRIILEKKVEKIVGKTNRTK
jgi:hypothetical protein